MVPRATYRTAEWLFLRLLGVVYLVAFASLATQVVGLAGHDGILPAAAYLDRARVALGPLEHLYVLPTLGWIGASDAFLRGFCIAGATLATLIVAGIAPAVVLPLAWLLYLSLSVVCRDFLAYQWDALLLETGLIAAFAAPWTWRDRPGDAHGMPRLGRMLLVWLLFRLMFGSGMIKLASGDPTWRGLTALSFHFWTQPLPTPVAWYADLLPGWMLAFATAATLAIELGAPFLILGPPLARRVACALIAGLQALIALTGNYAFFNLLSAALALLLLDDALLGRAVEAPADEAPGAHLPGAGALRLHRGVLVAFAAVTVPVSIVTFARGAGIDLSGVPVAGTASRVIAPLRSVNTYGLFAVMTTTRPEIVVEGSDDGTVWRPFEFKYKPTDPGRRPPWVAPHQPRLDWQMWFAALGRFEEAPWFGRFCERLLEGSPEVRALLARDPFDGRAPRLVRAVLYEYRFASPGAHRTDGTWWTRERVGLYSPVLSLESFPRAGDAPR